MHDIGKIAYLAKWGQEFLSLYRLVFFVFLVVFVVVFLAVLAAVAEELTRPLAAHTKACSPCHLGSASLCRSQDTLCRCISLVYLDLKFEFLLSSTLPAQRQTSCTG